jgi:prevent-host-death family protein
MPTLTIKSGEARAKFRDLLDQVMSGKGDVIIERNGKNVAVMIPAADYEEIRGKLEGVRAVREAAFTYASLKSASTRINPEEGTAVIPLDLYNKLVVEREMRFSVISEMQENAPDLSEEQVQEIVEETIKQVRAEHAAGRP